MRDMVTELWVMAMKRVEARAHMACEQVAEALDIGVVQGGVHFVEETDRGGIGEEDGEDQGDRSQGLFAPAHQAHDRHALAGRTSEDLQSGLQRIVGLDEA